MRRRTRRGRMFSLGLLFVIYSVINVYSSSDISNSAFSTIRPDIELNNVSTLQPKYSTAVPSNDESSLSTLETPQPTNATIKC